MPTQYKIDDIIVDTEQGTATFQIGPYGITKDLEWLFDRSAFNTNHMVKNLRLARNIGVKAELASREFLDSVNGGQKGMDLADNTWFIRSIALVPGSATEYTISFSPTKTGPVSYNIQIDKNDIEQDNESNPDDIFDNVKSFLRRGNYTSLTSGAINALKSRLFWA